MRLNPSATPPSTKDESAFLACILANKAFSPLIPGTRSSRGNHNAIRGPQASWAKAGNCPSVGTNGTSYHREKGLPNSDWHHCHEPNPAENRSSDSCSCIYLNTNGAISPKSIRLGFYHLNIWWGSKSTRPSLSAPPLEKPRIIPALRHSFSHVTFTHKSHSLPGITTDKAETSHLKKERSHLKEGPCEKGSG